MKKILIIDDEPDIIEILNYNLTKENYKVKAFENPLEAINYLKFNKTDLIISDWLMPGLDGLELCRLIKTDQTTAAIPIIMISCKNDEIDIVTALELGADDYLTKPFHVKELIVRVKKILKRNNAGSEVYGILGAGKKEHMAIVFDNLKIDIDNYSAFLNDKNMELTYSEFKLLKLLASQPGRVFTRDDIIDSVNGSDCLVTERAIDVQIVGLRKKLGNYRGFIETIRSVGYRFKLA
jgi:DNA-binding response OmpR family regulator